MTRSDSTQTLSTATLAGGCFWCLDGVYTELRGVHAVISGFTGGTVPNPGYEQVCSGQTGHAEAVQIHFDPSVVSYRDLLDVFFTIHDPTSLNRQGYDVGTHYRSAIFTHDADQEDVARAVIDELTRQQLWDRPIVTEIRPAGRFWPADSSHQDYFARNPRQPYCLGVVAPKVAKARKHFAHRFRAAET